MRVLGAILAGGQARRFGSDKAVALLGNRTLLEHVAACLRPQVDDLVVCGRTAPNCRCLPDRPAAGLGPLAGICAALRDGRERGFDAVATAPCDAPRLPADIVAVLAAAGAPSFVAELPVIGLWPVVLADALEGALTNATDRSMRSWARGIDAAPVTCGAIANINTLDDLGALAAVTAR